MITTIIITPISDHTPTTNDTTVSTLITAATPVSMTTYYMMRMPASPHITIIYHLHHTSSSLNSLKCQLLQTRITPALYFSYLHKTNIIVSAIVSAVKWTRFHVATTSISKGYYLAMLLLLRFYSASILQK